MLVTTFLLILPAELPDKSFITSIVLGSRLRHSAVIAGAIAAFGLQMAIAVTAGRLLTALPERAVLSVVLLLFAGGSFILLRHAFRGDDDNEDVDVAEQPKSWWRSAGVTFGLLFAAEWGDLTQLIAAAQSARTGAPLSVFLGAWAALAVISVLGVSVGKVLRARINVRVLHGVAGAVLGLLAVLTLIELLGI